MMNLTVPKKYADALFAVAEDRKIVEEVGKDIILVNAVLENTPKFKAIITHPGINKNEKISLLKKEFKTRISKTALDFIFLLIDKKREKMLSGICGLYSDKVDELIGVKRVTIETAYALSTSEKASVVKQLEKRFNKKLTVDTKVNAGILGGIIIRDKTTVIDGSVIQFYESLKAELKRTKVIKKKKAVKKAVKKKAVKKKAVKKKAVKKKAVKKKAVKKKAVKKKAVKKKK